MRRTSLTALIAIIVPIALLSVSTDTGAPIKQDPQARPRQTKPSPKPSPEPVEKPVMTTPIQDPDEAMRRAVINLSSQIGLLTEEMRKLRRDTERNSAVMELLLGEDRLSKVEDKIQEAVNN